jgi:hypothetical protein
MRFNDLDRFLTGFEFTCIPYKPIDKKGGLIKINNDTIMTRIYGVKSQMFYKGYDITECNMPPPIQQELFDNLPSILKEFYKRISDDFDTKEYYKKFLDEYNYFKETGRTTWL